jgi:hypothetical protein
VYIERSTRSLGNNVLKRIVLFIVVTQFVLCTAAQADLINITGASQQVGGEIGFAVGTTDTPLQSQFDPTNPLGLENADLSVSFSNSGVSLSGSLISVFLGDQVTANGSAFASGVWGSQPGGADDVHGGGASIFSLSFTRESSPAYFYVNGQIDIDVEGYPDLHPEEVFVYVKLSSDDGGATTIWEETVDGGNGDISIPVAHGLWLDSGKTYLLEAYAESGTMADLIYPGLKSRTASFSFTATASAVTIGIVQDTISSKTKTITCNIWPPSGYDVTQIDTSSILLNATIQPVQISVRRKQQMLVVKFPTSELSLVPGQLELSISGELIDGTPFEDSDTVTVVQKGGKK